MDKLCHPLKATVFILFVLILYLDFYKSPQTMIKKSGEFHTAYS